MFRLDIYISLPLFNIFRMKNLNLKMYELLNKFILICVHFYFHDKQKEGNWGCFLLFFSLRATFNIQMEIKCELIHRKANRITGVVVKRGSKSSSSLIWFQKFVIKLYYHS